MDAEMKIYMQDLVKMVARYRVRRADAELMSLYETGKAAQKLNQGNPVEEHFEEFSRQIMEHSLALDGTMKTLIRKGLLRMLLAPEIACYKMVKDLIIVQRRTISYLYSELAKAGEEERVTFH